LTKRIVTGVFFLSFTRKFILVKIISKNKTPPESKIQITSGNLGLGGGESKNQILQGIWVWEEVRGLESVGVVEDFHVVWWGCG
jgi:hypothetical protein